jgi:hypothetical protein
LSARLGADVKPTPADWSLVRLLAAALIAQAIVAYLLLHYG